MAKQSSNNTVYWIVGGVIILAFVGFGGYKLWHHYSKESAMQYTNTATPPANSTISQSTVQGNQTTGNSGLQNKTDSSNQQLQQDEQNVQNSMNQLQQDQGNVYQDTGSQAKDVPLQ